MTEAPGQMPPLLECEGVTVRFGGVTAVRGLYLSIRPGELVGLIGPNGAGKTTLFNTVTGVCRSYDGSVKFAGCDLIGLSPHRINGLGIARTFQNIRLFASMSVVDNVSLACQREMNYGMLAAVFRLSRMRTVENAIRERSLSLLRLMDLTAWVGSPVASLPYGMQRRLELARALATGPRLLLLDEPAAGMTTGEKADLAARIRRIQNEFELTIVVIEHDMPFLMGLCTRVVALDRGEAIASGSPEDVRANPRVIDAYLGDSGDAGSD
jgi:branched-chain amino acid transport system ATP-binding protein